VGRQKIRAAEGLQSLSVEFWRMSADFSQYPRLSGQMSANIWRIPAEKGNICKHPQMSGEQWRMSVEQ
jgi:hypothetical protein